MTRYKLTIVLRILILHPIDRLDKTVSKSCNTRPDAGCAFIQERRLKNYSGFAEVKAEYKKKDSLCTHQDLLGLALFGINAIEVYAIKCILMIQVIGKIILFVVLFINVYSET